MAAKSACLALFSHTNSSFRKTRKFIKRQTNKMLRRMSKRHGQDAPTNVVIGYIN